MELAEEGGFEAVRLRDLANHADVALGTLYKRFRSKEDILVAVLELELERLQEALTASPIPGETPLDRIWFFFSTITRTLVSKPNLARAVLRATASGEPASAEKVLRFNETMVGMISAAMIGRDDPPAISEGNARMLAFFLQQIWFASLVGWMGGLLDVGMVVEQVRLAADLLIKGVSAGSITPPSAPWSAATPRTDSD